MIRRSWLLSLVLVLMMLMPSLALADGDQLIPDRPDGAPGYGQVVPLYDDPRYEPWSYTFEGQDWSRADYASIYFWMNQLQVAKAWTLKMAIRTVEYAVRGDLVTPLLKAPGLALDSLGGLLWSGLGAPLLVGALGLAGVWALLLYLRGRTTRAWGAAGGSLLILLLSALVATAGSQALTGSITLSRGLAVGLFEGVGTVARGTDKMDLIARSGDSAWRVFVYEPWLTGELSAEGRSVYRTADGVDGGQFLAMTVTQRHNACLYNLNQAQANCPWWGVDFLPRRMLLAGWTAASGLVVSGVTVVLAGSIILAQLTLLLFIALAPVWLLAALWWPEAGLRLVRGVAMKAFGALLAQGVLAAALAVWLSLVKAVHAGFASSGWMLESVLLTGLALLVFRYRYAVWEPLTVVVEQIQRRAGQDETGRRESGEERERATRRPPAPAFADVALTLGAVPDVVMAAPVRATEPERSQTRPDRAEAVRPSPVEAFETQMQRVQREITLRQETQVYERVLERAGEQAESGSTSTRRSRPDHQLDQSPPPRPKA